MSDTISFTQPDDWHLHVRNGSMLRAVIGHTAACFGRALIMPNLKPPVKNAAEAEQYRNEILSHLPATTTFDPVMTLYLTDDTTIETVEAAAASNHVVGFKLYPAGATTNSSSGVTSISRLMPVLEAIADNDLVLQVHGEVTDPHVDIFDREAEFIEQILAPLHREISQLKIIFEHITTRQGVEFVASANEKVAATITPQHLLFSRNDIFEGGIRPHYYCLPILKRHDHRLALLEAATGGDPSFFLGTDSAPHTRDSKESDCGCAGMYSAHAAIELYAEVFEAMDALPQLEGFASFHGADFYQVPRNNRKIVLERKDWTVPAHYPVYSSNRETPDQLVPLRANENVKWKLVGIES